jgi:hypothetical protein
MRLVRRAASCTRARSQSVTHSITSTIKKIAKMIVEALRYWNRSKATLEFLPDAARAHQPEDDRRPYRFF